MDVVDQVLRRLERIEALDRGRDGTQALLDELRQLVGEAEAWARLEGDQRAQAAVDKLRAVGSTEAPSSGDAGLAGAGAERSQAGGGMR
jgi:hypothetical protein